jgi:tetratricopeptide (TPR) repeat protein
MENDRRISLKKICCILIIVFLAVPVIQLDAQQKIRNGKIAVTSAKVRLKYKKYDEALEVLEEGRKVDPGHAPLYPMLGSLYIQKREYLRADSAFNIAVSLDGKLEKEVNEVRLAEWSNLVNRGVKAMKVEEYDEAILHLQNATIMNPEGVEAYINLGASYSNSGQARESVKPFQKALELDPENIDLKLSLAKIYNSLGKPDSSKVYYKQSLAIEPDNMSVKEGLASCYLREGSVDSASTLYTELLSGEEVNPDIAFNAGLVEIQRANWSGAEKAFLITVENYPDDIEARENLSIALMQLEKYDEVVPHLEKIVELDNNNREAWGSLIVAYAQIGMNDKASNAHEKYKELGGEE